MVHGAKVLLPSWGLNLMPGTHVVGGRTGSCDASLLFHTCILFTRMCARAHTHVHMNTCAHTHMKAYEHTHTLKNVIKSFTRENSHGDEGWYWG